MYELNLALQHTHTSPSERVSTKIIIFYFLMLSENASEVKNYHQIKGSKKEKERWVFVFDKGRMFILKAEL